jgi:DNA-binding transcriptional LysR family regulator
MVVSYHVRMMTKTALQEITATQAAERLHLTRSNVIKTIKRGELTARLVTEAPLSYWLITIDAKFLAKEKERAQP